MPSLLLVLVVLTHYAPALLGGYYEDSAAAERAWFYILRGVEGTVLWLYIWVRTPYKPLRVRYGVALACAWGALEEAQTAACRLSFDIERRPEPGPFQGLCDLATGWPIYMLTLSVALIVATLAVREKPGSDP